MTIKAKLTFDELLEKMQHFLIFSDVENEMDALVKERAQTRITLKNGSRSSMDVIDDLLRNDDSDAKNLRTLISLTGGSLERMKRIISFFEGTTVSEMRRNAVIRRKVAAFLSNPEIERCLPRTVRREFALPKGWVEMLQDENYISANVMKQNDIRSKYSVKIGFKFEETVKEITADLGFTCEKGPYQGMDNKEVDVAIPSLDSPKILIMVAYGLTTSAAYTSKANEQAAMYSSLQNLNGSRMRQSDSKILFVNVIDGGGWLARPKDLRHIWANCDYCYTFTTLDDFRELVKNYMGG